MVILSCSVKSNISASLVITDLGVLADKRIERITGFDVDTGDQYRKLLHGVHKGLGLLKSYIDKNPEVDKVTLELNNQAVLNWLDRGYAKTGYEEEFEPVIELLDDIPVKFIFSHNKMPISRRYSKPSCLPKEKLSGLSI